MNDRGSLKMDFLCLGLLAGVCLLIGLDQVQKSVLVNPDGVFYIGQAQRLSGHYADTVQQHPMGYPCILWVAHRAALALGGRDSPMLWLHSAQAATLLCQILALLPLYLLGKLLVGAENSFWALLVLIVLPYPAQYAGELLREWPYVLFLSLGFWLLCWGLRQRHWWVFALVGLDAGVVYLIRPEGIQLVLYAFLGLAGVSLGVARFRLATRLGAGSLLVAGFFLSACPYVLTAGALTAPQFRSRPPKRPPVISAIGPQAASSDPLAFEVAAEQLLELPIHVAGPDGSPLAFTLAGMPVGSRPVYQFWSARLGGHFWTVRDQEKNLLLSTYSRDAWDYEGIVYYAYAQADARVGLHGVHRFWSPTRQRHFYTTDGGEAEALRQGAPGNSWDYEGVAFYAFAGNSRPPDTVPVYRSSDIKRSEVAWYAQPAGQPPAGAQIKDGVLCWRPRSDQKGDYQLNIIVDDGSLQSCQLIRIRVATTPAAPTGRPPIGTGADRPGGASAEAPLPQTVSLAATGRHRELLPQAVQKVAGGIVEDLMVIFFVPWLVGLYGRLRYQADRTERILIGAVVITNIALMFWRHVYLVPGEYRRYCLGMLALTAFYIPAGVEILARGLNRLCPLSRPRGLPPGLHQPSWFYLLLAVGITICLPKLLLPSHGNKTGYRAAAEWIRQNTPADAVLAVPDTRLSFYAQRLGLPYVQYPNAGRADYVVVIDGGEEVQVAAQWRPVYSVRTDRRTKKTLTIYSTGRKSDLLICDS
jgi:hypothetical protein